MNKRTMRVMRDHTNLGEILIIMIICIIFVASGYFSGKYEPVLQELVASSNTWIGILVYTAASALLGVVLAPASTLPFLPIAVALWGSWITAAATLFGWTIGATIAFILARKYGRPLVEKMINIKRAEQISKIITVGHPFWAIVIFRIFLPVDILSYAVGLFMNISLRSYVLATFLGLVPCTILFTQLASFSTAYLVLSVAVLFFFAVVLKIFLEKRRIKKEKHSKTA